MRSNTFRNCGLAILAIVSALMTGIASGATITGKILDPDREPVAEVLVSAVHVQSDFGGVARTNAKGEYTITDMPAGKFTVGGKKNGYRIRPVDVEIGEAGGQANLTAMPMMGAMPPEAVAPNPKNYTTYTLFYGTDRKAMPAKPLAYGAERGELALGTCTVSIPRDHRLGKLETRRFWKLDFRADPEKHVALLDTRQLSTNEFRALLAERISQTPSALVFVHGFNVSFEEAARRTAQFSYDLVGANVVPSFYSWPSNGSLLDYAADGEQAKRAVRYLVQYLRTVTSDPRIQEIHLVAHSMGNRVLTAALEELQRGPADGWSAKMGQVALVAPDIDSEIFREDIAPRIKGVGKRITLYASDNDNALKISKSKHNYPRAGDLANGVVIVSGVDTIDVSAVDTSFVGHSYFADNRSVIADLYALLTGNAEPGKRFGMRPLQAQGHTYWAFKP